ncbi:MAG TPA: LytTR family DNA-binding domain-containing protein [Bacteroidales bacterium]|nr:LytTR family DNA-binding domain-containing protein [Bacteroidales bacterium]
MRIINCIIVDDEPLALDLLESYVRKTSFLHLAARCSNAFEAIEVINNERVDLIFLDISMPELNGLEFSRTLSKEQKVVFTTAYEKYALEGYKVDALDYLLKPYNYEEFLKAANKVRAWFQMSDTIPSAPEPTKAIFVKSEYKLIKIDLGQILFIEGLKDYVKIVLLDKEKSVLSLMSLKSLELQLPPEQFMRIHRSYIINLNKIEQIERNQVIIGKTRITIADIYKEKFMKYIDSKSMSP